MLRGLGILLLLLWACPAAAQTHWKPTEPVTAKVVWVGDGDTLDLDHVPPGATKRLRVRLRGIDAPEKNQPCWQSDREVPCGRLAGQGLARLVLGKTVTCAPEGGQSYGRMVAICHVTEGAETIDVNAAMIRSGWAVPYVQYSRRYVADAEFARERKLGLWAMRFEKPACFRKPKTKGCPCAYPDCVPD